MPLVLTAEALAAVQARETDRVFLHFVEFNHETFEAPVRLVDNTEPVVFEGETFEPYPFAVELPETGKGGQTNVTIRLDNTDRRLVPLLRTIVETFSARLWVGMVDVPVSDPPAAHAELGPMRFQVRNMRTTAQQIDLTMSFEDLLNLAFPKDKMDPQHFRGLFPV